MHRYSTKERRFRDNLVVLTYSEMYFIMIDVLFPNHRNSIGYTSRFSGRACDGSVTVWY